MSFANFAPLSEVHPASLKYHLTICFVSSNGLFFQYSPKRYLVKYLVQNAEENSMELKLSCMTGEIIFQG